MKKIRLALMHSIFMSPETPANCSPTGIEKGGLSKLSAVLVRKLLSVHIMARERAGTRKAKAVKSSKSKVKGSKASTKVEEASEEQNQEEPDEIESPEDMVQRAQAAYAREHEVLLLNFV